MDNSPYFHSWFNLNIQASHHIFCLSSSFSFSVSSSSVIIIKSLPNMLVKLIGMGMFFIDGVLLGSLVLWKGRNLKFRVLSSDLYFFCNNYKGTFIWFLLFLGKNYLIKVKSVPYCSINYVLANIPQWTFGSTLLSRLWISPSFVWCQRMSHSSRSRLRILWCCPFIS